MNPLLRSTSLGFRLSALGVSVVVHAGAFAASVGSAARSKGVSGEIVSVDVLSDPAAPIPPAPAATFTPPLDHVVDWATPVHSNNVSRIRNEPRIVQAPSARVSAPHALSDARSDITPSFAIAIGAATNAGHGSVSPSGTAPARERADSPPAPEDSVDVRARLVRGLPPSYPPAARAEGVEGDVVLEIIVGMSGAVESARVVRAVGHGLDEAAVRAAYEFRFAPATREGQRVRVRMVWPMQFRLE